MSLTLRLTAATVLLALSVPATSQPVFDPNDSGTAANVSGDDDCGVEQPYICNRHKQNISAQSDQADEMLSSLEFGFAGGDACGLSAPRPVSRMQVVPASRRWNECPNGQANRTERLSTTSLPGPDYGLNRLRICTATDGTLQGVEARFFRLPHRSRTASGQNVVTRRFERSRCATWQAWSTCSAGRSAARINIFAQTENTGDVEGLQLVCKRVLSDLSMR